MRAAEVLKRADIVFHDALVHPQTIALAAHAQRVFREMSSYPAYASYFGCVHGKPVGTFSLLVFPTLVHQGAFEALFPGPQGGVELRQAAARLHERALQLRLAVGGLQVAPQPARRRAQPQGHQQVQEDLADEIDQASSPMIRNSRRRLASRPLSVPLSAMGWDSP